MILKAKIRPEEDKLFLKYQEKWILDKSRLKIMEKSRQIGISWSSAYALVRRKAITHAAYDAWVSSRDEIQARLFLEDCKKFARELNEAFSDFGEKLIEDEKTYILQFANGVKINSMSSSPDAQAGKRGDRLLDEFALHKDPRKLYSIAYPGITWGGQLEMVSTHRGTHNFFNELITEIREKGNPKKISLHRVTLEDALNDGFLYRLQSKLPADDERQDMDETDYFNFIKGGCPDEETFNQEYMCIPSDDASAFLSYDMLAACEYEKTPPNIGDFDNLSDLRECQNLYVGVDVARKKDFTVIWVNSFEGERHLCKRIVCLKNTKYSIQERILGKFLELPNMRRCCIDCSGLGGELVENMQDKYGTYRVEGVNFSAPVKEALAYPVKAAFEDLNVRIPFDRNLQSDLRAVKKETTAAGNIRFSADRSENGHSDRFWALALAIHAVSKDSDGKCAIEASLPPKSENIEKEQFNNPKRVIYENEKEKWPI